MARALHLPALPHPHLPAHLPRLPDPEAPDEFEEMTLMEHVIELRDRVMKMAIAVGIAFIGGLMLAGRVLLEITEKANAQDGLDIRSPSDPITLFMKIALYIAIAIAAPVIVYQLIAFLAPGLTNRERRLVYTSLPFVTLLFLVGVCYAFFFAIPRALSFLSNFQADIFNWQPDGQEVIGFYLVVMLGLGVAFQLPLVMFLLAKLGVLSTAKMRAGRRYAFIVILVAAAIITPTTDPFNMALVALPLAVLYEVGILISWLFARGAVARPNSPLA